MGFLKVIAIFLTMSVVGMCNSSPVMSAKHGSTLMNKELIILVSPPSGDTYYTGVTADIIDFHIAYARQILKHDDVLIFSAPKHYDLYVKALGKEHVVKQSLPDIWMRDYSAANAAAPMMFRYTAEGQGGGRKGQDEADYTQDALYSYLKQAKIRINSSDYLNDGGNFVDDYAGNVVISRKFLRDNKLTESQGRKTIQRQTGARNIAFIEADEQGGLEHADGVVAFIGANVLVINAYPEDQNYADQLKADLRVGLPGVTIREIVTPYDGSDIYDKRFGSACGLYTNMLVTPKRIYFPQFGIPEDKIALDAMRQWTKKEVIPVQSGQVCQMGGGVRCMSWQIRGPLAEQLLSYVRGS